MLALEVSSDVSISLFWIVLAALIAPIIGHATRRILPEVVLLLGLGVIIGPSALDLAAAEELDIIKQLGLGMLFLSAGYEIDTNDLRGRQVTHASITWVICLGLAVGLAYFVVPDQQWLHAAALGIALSSTALGTLMPILKEQGLMDTRLGKAVMAHGAVGELGPVAAMALLLSSNSPWVGALVLLGFAALTIFLAWFTRRRIAHAQERVKALPPEEQDALIDRAREWFITNGEHKLTQGIMRTVMLLLTGLMALAALFDIDVALGAFMAGICLRLIVGDNTEPLERRIGVLGNSFFIPVFFVISGMDIDLDAVGSMPVMVISAFFIVLLTRGMPVWIAERFTDTGSGLTSSIERTQLALYASAGLPIIVAVTEVAVSQNLMPAELGSCLVAAGACTVLVFPLVAKWLGRHTSQQTSDAATAEHDQTEDD